LRSSDDNTNSVSMGMRIKGDFKINHIPFVVAVTAS